MQRFVLALSSSMLLLEGLIAEPLQRASRSSAPVFSCMPPDLALVRAHRPASELLQSESLSSLVWLETVQDFGVVEEVYSGRDPSLLEENGGIDTHGVLWFQDGHNWVTAHVSTVGYRSFELQGCGSSSHLGLVTCLRRCGFHDAPVARKPESQKSKPWTVHFSKCKAAF
eukprot:1146781-Pelagomonas_calceolata.AAC.4